MDILVYGSSRPGALAEMCVRGLDGLGHNVSFFDRSFPHQFVWRVVDDIPGGERAAHRIRRLALLSKVSNESPDFILILKGYGLDQSLLEDATALSNAVVVNWNPDNPFQHRANRRRAEIYLDALQEYDIAYTWGEFLVDSLQTEGARDVRVLPFAHDPALHHPTETNPDYDCEVSFVGHWSAKRESLLGELVSFDLQIRGPGWGDMCTDRTLEKFIEDGAVRGRAYGQVLSSADIVVNILGDHNIPGHNMRTFEAPASGSLTITTRTEGQRRFFEEGEEVVMYDDARELREAVTYYLDYSEERESVAMAGLEAVRPHTYKRRMEDIVENVKVYL